MGKHWMRAGLLLVALAPLVALAADEEVMKSVGEVVAVDTAAKSVTVKTSDATSAAKEIRFTVEPQTKILKNDQPIELSQLQKADKVVVNYRVSAGKRIAVSIGVQDKGP